MRAILTCKNCERPYVNDPKKYPSSTTRLCRVCYRFEMDFISEEILNIPKWELIELKGDKKQNGTKTRLE